MKQDHYEGLSLQQVKESREKFGGNALSEPPQESIWQKLTEKFKDTIILILLTAFFASLGVAFYEYYGHGASTRVFLEPLGILIAILLATLVGFYFEMNADRKFKILNKVNDEIYFKVIRENQIQEVLKSDIVVGDVVILNTGEEIPADGDLLESVSLQVNESTLTGEPITRKDADKDHADEEATYPSWELLRGTSVVEGHGVFRVTKVGDATEYGKVNKGAQIDNKVKTPLSIQLDRLASFITKISYSVAFTLILVRVIILWFNYGFDDVPFVLNYLLQSIMMAVTVIVVSVPEGLPMSVTLSLALSMKRMLATNNLVRKLHACETMGAATVICTDKTGTLTQNQMRIHEVVFPNNPSTQKQIDPVLVESICVNSTAYLQEDEGNVKVLGNPTEGAFLLWLHDHQVDYREVRESSDVVGQLPFSTERKFMATCIQSKAKGARIVYLKGAPEVIFGLSKQSEKEGQLVSIDSNKEIYQSMLATYQSQGMRTLAFAYQIVDAMTDAQIQDAFENNNISFLDNVVLQGFAAISDPVRSDVPKAIQETLDAGIQVKVVTGDTSATAKEIARQVGLWKAEDGDEAHITGADFEALSDSDASERARKLKIMSRARPMDKERLVKLLQRQGEVVAVTGDGTNDAPALNAAQVGMSMGDGTTVAKEASDITIIDNSFTSIGRAVMWGRSLYKNIQRFLFFQLVINVVACVVVVFGAVAGAKPILTVTQMLWVNLIMDTFAALALASLPPSKDVMLEKPRKSTDYILTSRMKRNILVVGSLFVVLLLSIHRYLLMVDIKSIHDFLHYPLTLIFTQSPPVDATVTLYEQTLFFTFFVFLQVWNLFNAKVMGSSRSAFSDMKQSLKGFFSVVVLIIVGQMLIVRFGGVMFHVVPLNWLDWGVLLLVTSPVLLLGELMRLFKRK